MRKLLFISALFIFIFSADRLYATHIVGGEMNYHYLGGNNYEMTLTVYRDCFNGIPPFDDPASIGVFNNNNMLVNLYQIPLPGFVRVPNAINSPCLTPPTNVCYEVAQYVFNITLPATGGPFTVAYQRCCRNSSVVNLVNVQAAGATYFAVIDPSLAAINSNPVFNNWPPTFICRDAPFTFDHSATDFDGDSLVYELSTPYHGASQAQPMPSPPNSPPYTNVTFQPPYSTIDPLGGVPMQIDPETGKLTATPNSLGQFVYGIVVKEYRNGILIGQTVRDFQINVVNCPNITVASIYSPTIACGSLDAHFVNTSYNAATYSWFFGDPNTLNDTSTMMNPVYTYPDTGDYIATLVAYSGINVLCNDTARGLVHVYPTFLTDFYMSGVHCSNVFSFNDMSYGINGNANTWFWNFGDDSVAFDANPVHTFANPGSYNVMLVTSTDSACTDTMTKKVNVLPVPVSDFTVKLDTCNFEITVKNNSTYASASRWDFGDYNVAFYKEGKYKYLSDGTYDLSLIVVTDSSCKDTSYKRIEIPPLAIPKFDFSVPICDSSVQFINMSQNEIITFWEFGDNDTSSIESPVHTYSISGSVPVTLTVTSAHGCKAVLNKDIWFVSKKNPDFDIRIDSCKGDVYLIDRSNNAAFYKWDFGDGTISDQLNPIHRFINDGKQTVKLVVNAETACPDSITKTLSFETPLGEKIFLPNTFTPNGDGRNDIYSISIFRPCETYHLYIYNRWGQKVFETDDPASIFWDGSFNGEKLAEDVYVYILESEGNRREGTITILR